MAYSEICDPFVNGENKYEYLVEYRGDIIADMEKVDYACAYIINYKLAIVSVLDDRIDELTQDIPSILLVNLRSMFVLEGINANNTSNINVIKLNPYLGLTGSGVLIGIVDTGIDYMNKEFIREDDTTRIEVIWDQTINYFDETKVKSNINYNTVYGGKLFFEDDINAAIKAARNGQNPYDIVPVKDEIGHGTNIAGIVGARGYDSEVQGIAQDCNFVVVKLRQSEVYKRELRENLITNVPVYNNSAILSGIEYLKQYALYKRKPIVIVSAVGTTEYSHDGNDLFSRYVNQVSNTRGIIVISGCGNEGAAEGHASGYLNNEGDILTKDLNIPREMKNLNFRIWVRRPNKMGLSVISPSGQDSGFSQPKINEEETYQYTYENTSLNVNYTIPDSLTGLEIISLRFKNIKPGIWRLRLKGTYIVDGRFDIWLPPYKTLPPNTVFIESDPNQTMTAAGSAKKAVSVGFYNQDNNSIMAESGRGFPLDGSIKPDVVAPGFNINTVGPGDLKMSITGSTPAASITAGVCALILEWGIVKGNDTAMYSNKIISYITTGADKSFNVTYPNNEIGYGKLNIEGVFNSIAGVYTNENLRTYEEFYTGNLFVRKPYKMEVKSLERKI